MAQSTVEILIVGAGPTGLTLACSLRRQGVPCRIIDQSPAPSIHSKALGVHSRTLEVFYDLGVAEQLIERGQQVFAFNAYAQGKRIVHVGFEGLNAPYPFILSVPQSETERALIHRLQGLGGAVERPVELTDLVSADGRERVTLRHADGSSEEALYRFVVGCDGARSTVRKQLGLGFEGSRYEEGFLLADVQIDWTLPGDEAHAFLTPGGILAAIPMARPYHRLILDFPNREQVPAATFAEFQQAVAPRHPDLTIHDPIWVSAFGIHRRIVPEYRVGSTFLAGDAAHIHSPVGGQGMNTGVQDAYNLGWKLGLVVQGVSQPTLLQSYQPERRPIALQTLSGTDQATRVVTLRHPVLQSMRNHLVGFLSGLEMVQRRMTETVAGLRLGYLKSPIVGEYRRSVWSVDVTFDDRHEEPSLRTWYDFGGAPGPGERAPDVSWEGFRLHQLLQGPQHTLLLFDGDAPTEEGYQRLARVAQQIGEGPLATRVRPYLIVPGSQRPPELEGDLPVVLDPERLLHAAYGAGSECLYLIRPDGYVGYRSQPIEEERLQAALRQVFSALP